ncbi:hypothetical protein [Rummeliibacillus suwonensis]|uniref:hypothetical protein n=1 Tax=Rummeliibacillus suwonensis TaxID=1306154 RepID=UPI0028A21C05|nr:hypothetical protein [Rummeliibacillus suwonensis]
MTSPQSGPGGQNFWRPTLSPGGVPGGGLPPFGPPGGAPGGLPPFGPPGGAPGGGLPPGGPPPTGQMPTIAPPRFAPSRPSWQQGSIGISSCLFSNTYIWTIEGGNFWFYPIVVTRDQLIGYRWSNRRNRWSFRTVSRSNIWAYQCFR